MKGKAMRAAILLFAACVLVFAAGCLSISIGTESRPERFQVEGLASGYLTASALGPYDGTFFDFGLFHKTQRPGEIVSVDLWPIVGAGVGVVGARVRLFAIEFGLGALFYHPKAPYIEPEEIPEGGAETEDP